MKQMCHWGEFVLESWNGLSRELVSCLATCIMAFIKSVMVSTPHGSSKDWPQADFFGFSHLVLNLLNQSISHAILVSWPGCLLHKLILFCVYWFLLAQSIFVCNFYQWYWSFTEGTSCSLWRRPSTEFVLLQAPRYFLHLVS